MLSSNTSAVSGDTVYVEDVFSTYLYTGNGTSQTITNGIDLSTKGGLVWCKARVTGGLFHSLNDTARGTNLSIFSNDTSGQIASGTPSVTAFNNNGFSIGSNGYLNYNNEPTVSWTFRKQPKFFDVVTFTTGAGGDATVNHALGSTPGFVIVKGIGASDWLIYHRSLASTSNYLRLNATSAVADYGSSWITTSSTQVTFPSGGLLSGGATYVMYVYAHNAGGFGLTGTDNVISCGSFTTDGNGTIPATTLGYEPQYVMFKASSTTGAWTINDTMRGQPTPVSANASAPDATLYANNSNAESQADNLYPTATGFKGVFAAVVPSTTYIYIAIRRGPMKVPTDATKVFLPQLANTSAPTYRASFTIDMVMALQRTAGSHYIGDRLRGAVISDTTSTAAEAAYANEKWDYQTSALAYASGPSYEVGQCFRRAPSFFDEVCYTGTGANRTVTHNLSVAPEMILFKRRDASAQWQFYFAAVGNTKSVQMPDNDKVTSVAMFNNTSPTSSEFTVGISSTVNASGGTYVAYLAATCAGVSKVGTYTGTGTTQQINCGFTAGARFVLIKNVGVNDYAYGYYLWDSARGIVAGNDPYLLLSSTAAEVTSTDYIDPLSTGFEISSTAPAGINANGDQFVYWAIA